MNALHLKAHAKINLDLRVLRKREDGFHELTTRMAPIELADELVVRPSDRYELLCETPGVPTDESNLITRAVRLLENELGAKLNYQIELIKHIPHGAGLGGGSADAAVILSKLNARHGSPLPLEKLSELAAELGSDVPFFLHGCICDCSGRGESIVPRPELKPDLALLLLKPDFGVSTPDAYKRWQGSKELPSVPYGPQSVAGIEMVNDLERPVFEKHRFLAETKLWLLGRPEVSAAMMSGSGSTMIAVLEDPNHADQVVQASKTELDPSLWTWSGGLV